MANQVLAAQIIPRLGVTGLASPPPGRLSSHLDLLHLLYHQQHYNLFGFQGMGKICCQIDGKSHKARCLEGNDLMVQDGVHSGQEPLLVSTDEAQLGVLMNETAWRRSLSCSSLEVEIAAGSKYFFLNARNFAAKSPS